MAKNTALPKGVTRADIEAFLAAKKAEEAKAAEAKQKASKAKGKSEKTHDEPYAERKAKRTASIREEFPVEFHHCEITGGSKDRAEKDPRYAVGSKVDCVWVGANRYLGQSARIAFSDGSEGFIDPKFLKKGKPFTDAEKAKAMAERQAEADDTVYIAATVTRENDNAVLIEYQGWFSGKWFPKKLVTKTGATDGELPIWEIPAWKVRKDIGNDALDHLRSKQDRWTAMVNAE